MTTKNGLFALMLGESVAIGSGVFDGTTRYLGIRVGVDPELTPRIPIVSVAYAMVAGSSDVSSSDCHECDTIFVNVVGPEKIRSTADTTLHILNEHPEAKVALSAKVSSTSPDSVSAIRARAYKNQSGAVFAGDFVSENSGLGTTSAIRLRSQNYSDIFASNGVFAQAENLGGGTARGGSFSTESGGSGVHMGIYAIGNSNTDRSCYGVSGVAAQAGSGDAVGGSFQAYGGTGKRIGVRTIAEAEGDSATYGVYADAVNNGEGLTRGGYFWAKPSSNGSELQGCVGYASGTDQPATGIVGIAESDATGVPAVGCMGTSINLGLG